MGFDRIERDLAAEKLATLARITARLEALLAQAARLRDLASSASAVGDDRERESREAEHDLTVDEAERWRWYLQVQRDVMGLRHQGDAIAQYPLPRRFGRRR
jgi:hypothetical protein